MHRSTVTYDGFNIKVPWMWKEAEEPAGQRAISLTLDRARFGAAKPPEFISIRRDPSLDYHQRLHHQNVQVMTENLQTLASKLGTDFRLESLPLDSDIAAHYSCISPNLGKLPAWQVSCSSKDDLWSVDLFGPRADVPDLIALLRNLSSAQKQLVSR
ncbi:hypothetical protein [Edaphobacter bradus]|uniref:hypothetical protein n=1 Tax=Edaphobacter bradus TaxID=2259016 RepID=UPI0021E0BE99|nr:hypothetical protein [Edaphobacter bradus]